MVENDAVVSSASLQEFGPLSLVVGQLQWVPGIEGELHWMVVTSVEHLVEELGGEYWFGGHLWLPERDY